MIQTKNQDSLITLSNNVIQPQLNLPTNDISRVFPQNKDLHFDGGNTICQENKGQVLVYVPVMTM